MATMALSRSNPKGILSFGFGFSLFLISPGKIHAAAPNSLQFAGSVWFFNSSHGGYILGQQELSYLICNINLLFQAVQ